jgi:hypothetical protein
MREFALPASSSIVAVRLPAVLVDRLDALSAQLSRPGMRASRGSALRVALLAGLDAIAAESPDAGVIDSETASDV